MKMRSTSVLVIALLLLSACSSISLFNNKKQGPPVGKVGDTTFYFDDLKNGYQPVGVVNDTLAALRDFLPSFLLYEAKIKEAQNNGVYQDSALLAEYQDFGTRAAYAYWIENDLKEAILNEYMKRSEEELLVSYMLIRLNNSAKPADTLRAYNKLIEARNQIINGADFDSLSAVVSTKSRGRSDGGQLYYVSAGTTVEPFENQMYSLPLDSVSMPFRTRFGMHLAQVKDRRKRQPDRKISHFILFDRSREYQQATVDSLISELSATRQQLLNGAPWDSLVRVVSQDNASKTKGGDIGWFNNGRVNQILSDSIMNMPAEIGYISKPFYSEYGVQMLRLDSIRTFEFDQQKRAHYIDELKANDRFKADDSEVRAKVASKLSIKVDSAATQQILDQISLNDSLRIKEISSPLLNASKVVLQINEDAYSNEELMHFFYDRYPELAATKVSWSMVDEFKNDKLSSYILPISRQSFPDFDATMKRYMEGLGVFKVTEDSVWNYAKQDTAALERIFKEKQGQYVLPERIAFIRFASIVDTVLQDAVEAHKSGMPIDSILAMSDRLIIRSDSTSFLSEEPFTPLQSMSTGEYSDIYSFKGRKTIIFHNGVLPARKMRFDEAIYRVISDYQSIREKEWEASLKERYNIQQFPENIPSSLQ